jgi:hypothetical protein
LWVWFEPMSVLAEGSGRARAPRSIGVIRFIRGLF